MWWPWESPTASRASLRPRSNSLVTSALTSRVPTLARCWGESGEWRTLPAPRDSVLRVRETVHRQASRRTPEGDMRTEGLGNPGKFLSGKGVPSEACSLNQELSWWSTCCCRRMGPVRGRAVEHCMKRTVAPGLMVSSREGKGKARQVPWSYTCMLRH